MVVFLLFLSLTCGRRWAVAQFHSVVSAASPSRCQRAFRTSGAETPDPLSKRNRTSACGKFPTCSHAHTDAEASAAEKGLFKHSVSGSSAKKFSSACFQRSFDWGRAGKGTVAGGARGPRLCTLRTQVTRVHVSSGHLPVETTESGRRRKDSQSAVQGRRGESRGFGPSAARHPSRLWGIRNHDSVVDLSGVQERPDEICSGSDQQVNLLSPVLTGNNLRSPHLPHHLSHVSCMRILDDCHRCHEVHISPEVPRLDFKPALW